MADSFLALLDDLTTDAMSARDKLQTWLAKEADVKSITKLARQLSAAQESLKKCRDGETITLSMQNEYAAAKLRCQRRGGQLLKAMELRAGRKAKNPDTVSGLQDQLGTDTADKAWAISSRWQRIADVPDDVFNDLVDVEKQTTAEEEITAAALLRKSKAVHVSQNTGLPEWYTPPEYIEAARTVLSSIDLDPASSALAQKIVKAKRHYTIKSDGLQYPWNGTVWLNPPYASGVVDAFMLKLKSHFDSRDVSSAITLTNNSTDTAWFQECCESAAAICLVSGRIKFLDETGKPGAPLQGQAILYFGRHAAYRTGAQPGVVSRYHPCSKREP